MASGHVFHKNWKLEALVAWGGHTGYGTLDLGLKGWGIWRKRRQKGGRIKCAKAKMVAKEMICSTEIS